MKQVFNLVSLISFLLSRPSFASFELFCSLYSNSIWLVGLWLGRKQWARGIKGGGGGEGVAVIMMKIKTARIPRLVVVPEELTKVSELIFVCKRNQM